MPARILIADDASIARTTIRAILDWHSFQVCGKAKNGKEAIERVKELKPDIILLDVNMPELNGVKAAYEIRRVSPSTQIVFLTIHNAPATKKITKMWSHGFVAKSARGTELIPTLDRLTAKPEEKPPRKAAKSKSRSASGAG